ncbi:benzoate carboxyl methyltransferase [Dorcoceras hygrometricum]|uniref:Benzoate carboxyl methyltransferase n=1 Tax=Dorcoceras hygrometricum TaxID=472368 RepID=A0A2Z7CDT8_9LAMI|nr:benzoate carboxyl methyltransferase [Dorcoceras hygrometricum]
MSKSWDLVDETIRNMFKSDGFSVRCFNMVDLGCASGPNALSVLSNVMLTVQEFFKYNDSSSCEPQEFQFFLNDLPDNDFNSLFKLAENFKQEKGLFCDSRLRCFIYGLPGSFYTRLFPRNSLHFAYSSFGLHWLSQVPQGLESENKDNIYIAPTSTPKVLEAYAKQYRKDLVAFLSSRAEEMVRGGRMVLTFIGRASEDPSSKDEQAYWTILSQTLLHMVDQGLLKRDDLYSFNLPIYTSSQQEVESIVNYEGSFKIDKFVTFPARWDAHAYDDELDFDKKRSGKLVADCIRAVTQPMLVSHFGELINCDVLFAMYAERLGEHLSNERSEYYMLSISLHMR